MQRRGRVPMLKDTTMAPCCWPLLLAVALLLCRGGHGATVEHTFDVGNLSVSQLCRPARVITAVNGQFPGPTIRVHEGDTVVVHVVNSSPHNITVHWHGLFQRGTQWADGPEMVTQCPIRPGGGRYTYRYNATGQEGTLWWHAHSSMLRATVYGAIVIKPRDGDQGYPFPKPDKEEIIMLGEWWNGNVFDLERKAFLTGNLVPPADAYTINGRPGDLHKCRHPSGTKNHRPSTFRLKVRSNSTYLLRIINAGVNTPLFFKIAGHAFTVVGADASYTAPYRTDVVVVAPGQTVDALMAADASPARRYYMVASPYNSAHPSLLFLDSTATAVVEYVGAGGAMQRSARRRRPLLAPMPRVDDTATAYRFLSSLAALVRPGHPAAVPLAVDVRMFVAMGLGFADCRPEQTRCRQQVFAGSMNNASFVLPVGMPLLEAHYRNASGVYTRDFPDRPPLEFNYTRPPRNMDATTTKSTKVRTVPYNSTVEVVLQNTALVARESHPMHLHGHNFFVLAQGFGNFDQGTAVKQYNIVNPQERNTLAVPTGGWVVIRFVANNPGMWIMHCHFDAHLPIGLAMVFEVQDGPTPETALPPPPADLPQC